MKTSEVLYRAADLIEERGWAGREVRDPWGGGEGEPVCLEGAIIAAYAPKEWVRKTAFANTCPAGRAVRDYLSLGEWDEVAGTYLYDFNDRTDRNAAEVIEVLRAAAVIEAAKETADERVSVTA